MLKSPFSPYYHDLLFHNSEDPEVRRKADKILIDKAWERVTAKDTPLEERLTAYLVTNLMKAKVAMGGGMGSTGKKQERKKWKKNKGKRMCAGTGFPHILSKIRSTLKKKQRRETFLKQLKLL